jgi:hypothetical protein
MDPKKWQIAENAPRRIEIEFGIEKFRRLVTDLSSVKGCEI